jgi:hypothetical protein
MADLEEVVGRVLALSPDQVTLQSRVFVETSTREGLIEVDMCELHAPFTINDGLVFIVHQNYPSLPDVLEYLDRVRNSTVVKIRLYQPGVEPMVQEATADFRVRAADFFSNPFKDISMFVEDPTLNDVAEVPIMRTADTLADLMSRDAFDHDTGFHIVMVDKFNENPSFKLCLRFVDDKAVELGWQVVAVQGGTLADALVIAAPPGGFDDEKPARAYEVIDGRIQQVYHWSSLSRSPVESLACYGKSNFVYNCVMVEAYTEVEGMRTIRCTQIDKAEDEYCGPPFLLDVYPGETAREALTRKLQLPESWRIVEFDDSTAEVYKPTAAHAVANTASRNLSIK